MEDVEPVADSVVIRRMALARRMSEGAMRLYACHCHAELAEHLEHVLPETRRGKESNSRARRRSGAMRRAMRPTRAFTYHILRLLREQHNGASAIALDVLFHKPHVRGIFFIEYM